HRAGPGEQLDPGPVRYQPALNPLEHSMNDTPASSRPSIAEVAALTARLRALSQAARNADRDEVDHFLADKRDFLADKRDLLDRITPADTAHSPTAGGGRQPAADRDPAANHRTEPPGAADQHAVRGVPPDRTGIA